MSERKRRQRRQHNDRTHDGGPHPDALADAMRDAFESLARGEGPEVPDLGTLTTLREFASAPFRLGEGVVIRHIDITCGRPRNGALMSDSHVSGFEADVPLECPDCGETVAEFDYHRHHNIAGKRVVECLNCEYAHSEDRW